MKRANVILPRLLRGLLTVLLVITLIHAVQVSVNAWMIPAEAKFFGAVYDDEGNIVSVGFAFRLNSGKLEAYTAHAENAEAGTQYMGGIARLGLNEFTLEKGPYAVNFTGSVTVADDDREILDIYQSEESPEDDPPLMSVDTPRKGQTVTAVCYHENGDFVTESVTIGELIFVGEEGEAVMEINGPPDFYLIGYLLDVSDHCLGIIFESGQVYLDWFDEAAYQAKDNGESEPTEQPGGLPSQIPIPTEMPIPSLFPLPDNQPTPTLEPASPGPGATPAPTTLPEPTPEAQPEEPAGQTFPDWAKWTIGAAGGVVISTILWFLIFFIKRKRTSPPPPENAWRNEPEPTPPTVQPQQAQYLIRCTGGVLQGWSHSLDGFNPVSFGRDPGSTAAYPTNGLEREVDWKHAVLYLDQGHPMLLSQTSMYTGLFRNGQMLSLSCGVPCTLTPGDVFCIGSRSNSFVVTRSS